MLMRSLVRALAFLAGVFPVFVDKRVTPVCSLDFCQHPSTLAISGGKNYVDKKSGFA